MKNLEEFTSEQVLEILNEEFEESGNHSSENKPSKEEIDNLIKITSKETINKLEYNPEIDDFMDIDENENISKAKEHFNEEDEESKDGKKIVINLNDKYGFKVGNINYNDITFKNSNKKLIYKKTEYFKCSNDYNNKRYFTCANYNRKSKVNSGEKMCNSKIIVYLTDKTALISILHSNECLEFIFGKNMILPSISKEIEKRNELMVFADKLLSLNPGISLTAFKDVIYLMIAIKKYTLNASENYLKNYFYNWKNKNRVNTFYFAHDNPLTLDNNIFLQSSVEKIIFVPEKNKNIRLIYLIWSSPYHLNRLRFSPHYYMDFTFIKPIGMLETLVVLYIDLYTGIKVPGCFITLNSKTQTAFEIIFNDFKNILKSNNTISLALQTYTIDFEKALENALKKISVQTNLKSKEKK